MPGRGGGLTAEGLKERVMGFGGDFEVFLKATGKNYVEAEVWEGIILLERVGF